MTDRRLVRDTSDPRKRAWWKAVLEAAAGAPVLVYEPEHAPPSMRDVAAQAKQEQQVTEPRNRKERRAAAKRGRK